MGSLYRGRPRRGRLVRVFARGQRGERSTHEALDDEAALVPGTMGRAACRHAAQGAGWLTTTRTCRSCSRIWSPRPSPPEDTCTASARAARLQAGRQLRLAAHSGWIRVVLRVREVKAMAVDIKKVSRTIAEEVYGKGRLEYLDQVCDPSFKSHDPLSGEADLAGVKREVETYRTAFPDMKVTVLALCGEADLVCMHWRCAGTHEKRFLGVEPTGKKITIEGITFDRFRNGKLIESFAQWETLGLLQALGLVPRIELAMPKAGAERRPHA